MLAAIVDISKITKGELFKDLWNELKKVYHYEDCQKDDILNEVSRIYDILEEGKIFNEKDNYTAGALLDVLKDKNCVLKDISELNEETCTCFTIIPLNCHKEESNELLLFGLNSCKELVKNWVNEFDIDLTIDSNGVLTTRIFELVIKFKKEIFKLRKELEKSEIQFENINF